MLAVLVDPALQRLDDHRVVAGGAVLVGHGVQPAAHLRLASARGDEAGQRPARVREQHVLDEGDAAGGALDVGEDGPGHATQPAWPRS